MENKNNNISAHLSPHLLNNIANGEPRGDGIPSSSQIDSFLTGIRNSVIGINLPPPPSLPSQNKTPKVTPTQILQINLQHSKTASANLSKLSESKGFAICLIQEPWVTKRGISGLPPQIVKQHALIKEGDPHTRAAILHKRALDIWPVPQYSDRDVCTCIWYTKNHSRQTEEIWLISAGWPTK